jgi:hypothetical protein
MNFSQLIHGRGLNTFQWTPYSSEAINLPTLATNNACPFSPRATTFQG